MQIHNLYHIFYSNTNFTTFTNQNKGKFSISPVGIGKIPLNPPLQKGEAVGMPELFEMLQTKEGNYENSRSWQILVRVSQGKFQKKHNCGI